MNDEQLQKLIEFVKPYYVKDRSGQFHDWRHIVMVHDSAIKLAESYPKVNLILLEASCYIHDVGRVNGDENHPAESIKICTPFLKKLGIKETEISIIEDAVLNHGVENIELASTLEAKLLFDADKLQILSVYGFLRCWAWLVDERKMDIDKAMNFLWEYVNKVFDKYVQTAEAKKIMKEEMVFVKQIVDNYNYWNGYSHTKR